MKKLFILIVASFFLFSVLLFAEIDFSKIKEYEGIPVYPNSKFSKLLSSFGKSWIVVYHSNDDFRDILSFYKEKLNMNYKKVKYGKALIVYQFPMAYTSFNGKLWLKKGVEVIPYGGFYRKVFKAKVKIKIYITQITN